MILDSNELLAGILAIVLGIAFIGNIAAWVIWGITTLFSSHRK